MCPDSTQTNIQMDSNTTIPRTGSAFLFAWIFSVSCLAQDQTEATPAAVDEQPLDRQQIIENMRAQGTLQPRVLAPTIAPEEIDQAVLNRLLQEIIRSPEVAKIRLGVDDNQLQDIYVAASNARSFINGSEMQNVRAMCNSWNQSALTGDDRVNEALDAYKAREQLTRNFIAKYYRVVLAEIEANLSTQAKSSFNNYMDDRRSRMANAGIVSPGAIVQNLYDGTDSIKFHCRN